MKSSTETLIAAMRILSQDIQSDDGVANAAIAEAAQRLEEQQERIKRLEEEIVNERRKYNLLAYDARAVVKAWEKVKEAKP